MTHALIDRALAEATLRELNLAAVTYAALGKVILKDGAEAMRDKLSAALANAEPTGWQKIETAPKDKSVMLHCRGFIPFYCGRKRYGNLGEPQQSELAWRCDSSGRFANPTHWMPLPAAPGETP